MCHAHWAGETLRFGLVYDYAWIGKGIKGIGVRKVGEHYENCQVKMFAASPISSSEKTS